MLTSGIIYTLRMCENVPLSCNADGNPPSNISWICIDAVNAKETTEGRQMTITVTRATSTNAGVYMCCKLWERQDLSHWWKRNKLMTGNCLIMILIYSKYWRKKAIHTNRNFKPPFLWMDYIIWDTIAYGIQSIVLSAWSSLPHVPLSFLR